MNLTDGGMKRGLKILFIAEGVSVAHVARPALLARWAAEAGHEVHFACGRDFAWVARGEGLNPVGIETVRPEDFYSRLSCGKFFYTSGDISRYISAEIELISRIEPDLVVGDFRLTLPVSAWYAGVKCMSLANAYWSPAAGRRLTPPENGFFGLLPEPVRETLFAALRPLAFRMFAAPLDRARKQHGLRSFSDFREHYTAGDYCAFMDLRSLVPLPTVPANQFYLGPVIWHPRGLPGPDLGALGNQRPLAYVTMGSSGDRNLLPEICRAALAAGCELVVSGVRRDGESELRAAVPGLAGRSVLGQFFSPGSVLARAALTICHGGNGTVYQSLEAGVPAVCLAANPDQFLMSEAVQRAGAAVVARPSALPAAIMKALDGAHAAAARRVAGEIAAADTRSTWLSHLETLRPAAVSGQVAARETLYA